MAEFLSALVALTGAFIAGWFVATDKNRNEIYKRRLNAYEKLMDHVQFIAMLSIAGKVGQIEEGALLNAKVALTQAKLANILYLSKDFSDATMKIYHIENMETDDIFRLIAKLAKHAAKDLHVKRHNFISALAALEIQLLRKQQEVKAGQK